MFDYQTKIVVCEFSDPTPIKRLNSEYSRKRTLLSPHVAALVSASRFHLSRAASDISPPRDRMADGQSYSCVPLSPPHLLQHEDRLCLNDSCSRRGVSLASDGCSGDIFGAVVNHRLQPQDTGAPRGRKEDTHVYYSLFTDDSI